MLSGLLLSLPHRYHDELTAPAQPGAPRAIRRALDAIQDEPERPFSVADLAAIAGMSVRSLQEGFRRHVGCAPMTYLQQVRLLRVHDELRHADPPGSRWPRWRTAGASPTWAGSRRRTGPASGCPRRRRCAARPERVTRTGDTGGRRYSPDPGLRGRHSPGSDGGAAGVHRSGDCTDTAEQVTARRDPVTPGTESRGTAAALAVAGTLQGPQVGHHALAATPPSSARLRSTRRPPPGRDLPGHASDSQERQQGREARQRLDHVAGVPLGVRQAAHSAIHCVRSCVSFSSPTCATATWSLKPAVHERPSDPLRNAHVTSEKCIRLTTQRPSDARERCPDRAHFDLGLTYRPFRRRIIL